MEYLTATEVLLLHARLIQRIGGSGGLRDMGLLESALGRLQATFEGKELYPDLWSKAAALMHSLIRNHPFVDGNKRMALTATGLFLELNGYQLTTGSESVLAFVRRVVRGDMELGEMASWLEAHSDPLNT